MENVATEEFISRTEALKDFESCNAENPNWTPQRVKTLLLRQPAADVAPVVRCKDCEHAERYERKDGTAGYYCGHQQNSFTYGERWDRVFKPAKEADDFCSYGEYQTNTGGVTHE